MALQENIFDTSKDVLVDEWGNLEDSETYEQGDSQKPTQPIFNDEVDVESSEDEDSMQEDAVSCFFKNFGIHNVNRIKTYHICIC